MDPPFKLLPYYSAEIEEDYGVWTKKSSRSSGLYAMERVYPRDLFGRSKHNV